MLRNSLQCSKRAIQSSVYTVHVQKLSYINKLISCKPLHLLIFTLFILFSHTHLQRRYK